MKSKIRIALIDVLSKSADQLNKNMHSLSISKAFESGRPWWWVAAMLNTDHLHMGDMES
jgi:hypothetical protein